MHRYHAPTTLSAHASAAAGPRSCDLTDTAARRSPLSAHGAGCDAARSVVATPPLAPCAACSQCHTQLLEDSYALASVLRIVAAATRRPARPMLVSGLLGPRQAKPWPSATAGALVARALSGECRAGRRLRLAPAVAARQMASALSGLPGCAERSVCRVITRRQAWRLRRRRAPVRHSMGQARPWLGRQPVPSTGS
eukprot:scaffold4_cov396-Prasinococcus_capsulatus_cf.AAC.9